MEKIRPKENCSRAEPSRVFTRALAACLLVSLASAFCAAQSWHAPPQLQRRQAAANAETREDDKNDADEQAASRSKEEPRVADPATILRRARLVYVESDSVFVNAHEVEDSLRKRKEFQAWGMIVTRSRPDADLVIQITRKSLTRRFTFTVVDPRTEEVVASGKMRSVLFGKKIPNKVAEQFANRVKIYRPYPPTP
jgi:hypothetical protein